MLSPSIQTPARVAQWIERLPPEQEVAGSTPAAGIVSTQEPLKCGFFLPAKRKRSSRAAAAALPVKTRFKDAR